MDQPKDIDNERLVKEFGAELMSKIHDAPDFYAFKSGILYSHRDFDKFLHALKKGEKCAIVSGVNASGTFHLGHKAVFDLNLFFQKRYDLPVFIPISDDESYVAGKVKDQKEALKNSMELAKELLAYGFDPKKTYFIIDQIYTNIYNFAIKYSKSLTLSTIKATYGYEMETNAGLFFYPTIQSAHILLPFEKFNFDEVLVPIGPDEDTHIRICRDIAPKFGLKKPCIIHSVFLPGLTGEKMSASRPETAVFMSDDEESVRKKCMKSFSGGRDTLEEHRKHGGDTDNDIACIYLSKLFLPESESKKVLEEYKKGKLLSSEVKKLFADNVVKFVSDFKERLSKVKKEDVEKCILRN